MTARGEEASLHEWALPLLVAEGSGSLEDDFGAGLELGQVKRGAGGDSDVVKGDGRA